MAEQTFTSGQILTAAQMTTLQTNIGLAFITSASATSGSSLSVDNCFTSTYSAYRIVINRATVVGLSGLNMRLRAASSDTATNYYNIRVGYDYSTSSASVSAVNNGTQFELPLITDTTSAACVIDVYNPKLALKTQTSAQGSDSRTAGLGAFSSSGMLNNTTSYDGFSIVTGSAFTNISLTVYGYRLA